MQIPYNFGSDATKIHDKPTSRQEMRSQHGEWHPENNWCMSFRAL